MKALLIAFLALGLIAQCHSARADEDARTELDLLLAEFREYSGVKLVFQAGELPAGEYYDIMPELQDSERLAAAKIACREVQKYPPQYLGALKLKAIGIFRACVSRSNDGFHPYDKALAGYRYFGLYNQRDAVVAAYYSDDQLPLTLHHEIFHHIDRLTPAALDWSEMLAARERALELTPADQAAASAAECRPRAASRRERLCRQEPGRGQGRNGTLFSECAGRQPVANGPGAATGRQPAVAARTDDLRTLRIR